MKKFSIASLILIFLIPAVSFAANLTGNWSLNGGGYEMTMQITQSGTNISGTLNNSPGETIEGSVVGRTVVFTRTNDYLKTNPGAHPQVYTGYLFTTGPMGMAGTFKHRNSSKYGWYANKK